MGLHLKSSSPPTELDPNCLADLRLGARDRNLEKSNRRAVASLLAWAEVLDALGWCVALHLPGATSSLSGNARKWASGQACEEVCWAAITAHVSHANPSNILISTDELKVWLETETLPQANQAKRPCELLTRRESEICGWLREGKTGPEIAIILGCGQRTVESHVARLYRKLGVQNRAQFYFQTLPAPCSGYPATLFSEFTSHHLRANHRKIAEIQCLKSMWNALASGLAQVSALNDSNPHLSATEGAILAGLIRSQSREMIAEKLRWRRDTLDRRVALIRERLGFENTPQLLSTLAALKPMTSSAPA